MPDVIGQTVGSMIAGGIKAAQADAKAKQAMVDDMDRQMARIQDQAEQMKAKYGGDPDPLIDRKHL